ncbi:MAG: 2-oxo acid dehydrogenase subunit E2 [Clostridiales Family XIII bacterium]|jgi:pyruvate dehydrogenase E2 component (dihydrolipoamide acetyltransferase)|nr:2-oxo acid dehydrogenase subunit E2 [Clostridiales Family XIII bacterium]
MAEAVLMPKSGISVESCIIGTWKKSVGDSVGIGDILFDYETDKASFECESTAEGVILEIFFQEGDEVEVLKPVCAVGAEGDDISAIRGEVGGAAASEQSAGAPAQGGAPTEAAPTGTAAGGPATGAASAQSAPSAVGGAGNAGDKVSPRARDMADRLGLYVGDAIPTGPNGRVIERDIAALAERKGTGSAEKAEDGAARTATAQAAQGTPAEPEPAPEMAGPYTDEKFAKIRSVIAASMHASLANTAQLTHHHSFDATEVQTVRKAFKESGNPALQGVSIGDMILYAVVKALQEYPDMNAHLVGGSIMRRFEDVNLGVAVDTPRGLMVPTIFAANKKSLIEISAEVKQLAADARTGSINPDLLQGGTFTVSNLGPTGVEVFTPILNPPQVGIFGICGIQTKVRQSDSGIHAYPSIGMSLTYDHRAVDGAPASRFAQAVCGKLAQFSKLLDE